MDLMIVHPAIQDELVLGRPLESEARLPVLVVLLREGKSSLREIDGGAIKNERIVRALKDHTVGKIEDGAPPTSGVGEEWRAWLFVDRHLAHLPDAIERWERSAAAQSIPVSPALLAGQAYEPQTKYDLRGKCDPVGPDATEELRFGGKRGGPVQQKESDQAQNVGDQEKAAEQDEVDGKQLCYHIVRHGQHKHLDHVGEADQGAQGGRAREDQQQSGCEHGAAGKNFISWDRAD